MSTTENGGFGGMLRELKLTLNELFSGGKLEPEQELTVQVLFGLLGYLSNVDGIVTDHEVTMINSIMDERELPMQARQRALDALARGRRREMDVSVELKRYLEVYSAQSAEVSALYTALLRLAAADGRIRPREREFLQEVTMRLGFPPEELEPRLNALL